VPAEPAKPLRDVLAPGLDVLFCGINPSLLSAARGHHFARPGNRFWPALHLGAFTDRQLRPDEQRDLLHDRLGITNLVPRATARADELTADELRAGGRTLAGKLRRYRPGWLAVLGVTAYRVAFGAAGARVGPQPDRLAGVPVWVLPNPSGLNASWPTPRLAEAFQELRRAADVRTSTS
jgi:TDG/mug DNA glycosylase family protein